jgi:hypothetical protein
LEFDFGGAFGFALRRGIHTVPMKIEEEDCVAGEFSRVNRLEYY